MRKSPEKNMKIQFWATEADKNKIQRFANLDNKTMSEYILNATLSPKIDKSNVEILMNLNKFLEEIRNNQNIITRLILTMATEQLPVKKDDILNYYNNLKNEGVE